MARQSLPFTQENVDAADRFIDGLVANGGTEILQPMMYALKQPKQENKLRVIVFLTDGQVGNEAEILQQVSQNLNETRIFAFGIDNAVNEAFLNKLAEIGHGTAEFLLPAQQKIEAEINRFQTRISAPLLTDLAIDWGGLEVANV